ncbi:MAG TPA: mechanosensitive ion channel domain-containing protein [Flavobacteriaceae bacterium]|nr:mechanosensitive ion channel domain-containing protein [Flavobacteriaceae bacterium]
MKEFLNSSVEFIKANAFNAIVAILILLIGFWLSNKVVKISRKLMERKGIDVALQNFLGDLLGWALKILVFITAISQVGIETTSFIAVIGAAGLAIGLALQGSLANFAGGALIMFFKPFKVGDVIEAQGELGVVKEIEIFVTKLTSPQNKLIIIPNGSLSNGNIINYTEEGKLRVDLNFGVGYDSDIKKTKEVLMNVLRANSKILKDPAPTINVSELGDSAINFAVRPWTKSEDYWSVYYNITEKGKEALDNAGIDIPYPHRVAIAKTPNV